MSLYAMGMSPARSERSRGVPRVRARGSGVPVQGFLSTTAGFQASAVPAIAGVSPATGPIPNPATTSTTLEAAATANVLQFIRQLTALLPAEILAVYIIAVAGISTNAWPNGPSQCALGPISLTTADAWLWITTVISTALCPAIVYLIAASQNGSFKGVFSKTWWGMLASLVGFVAWTMYIQNSIIAHCLQLPPFAGVIIVVLTTTVIYVFNLFLRTRGGPAINIPDIALTMPQPQWQPGGASAGGQVVANGRFAGGSSPAPVDVKIPNGGTADVLANPKIFSVFFGNYWKSGTGAGETQACNTFLRDFIGSSLYDKLKVYGVGQATITGDTIADMDDPKSLTDAEVQSKIGAALAQNGIPILHDTVVLAFCPNGITFDPQDATEVEPGTALTGYHSLSQCAYAVILYPQTKEALNGKKPKDALATEICHELAEAVTNPWIKHGGFRTDEDQSREIGDLCQTVPASIGSFNAQALWINGTGCAAS